MPVYGQGVRDTFLDELDEAYDLLYDDPHKAIDKALDAYDIAKGAQDYWAMAIGKGGMGYISYEVGDYEAAYKNSMAAVVALEKADTVDLYNKTLMLNHLSIIHSDFNNHDEAIRYGELALEVAKKYIKRYPEHAKRNDQLRLLVDIPYYMAIEYQEKGSHQTAGEILVDLWDRADDKGDIVIYSQVLNELGIIKKRNGEFSAAQEYFGLVVAGSDVLEEDKCIAYHNLAGSYLGQGNYDRAESYYLIALDLAESTESAYSQFVTYLDLGELEFKRGDKVKAIDYWERGLNVYDEIQSDPELYSVYNWLQLAYMDIDVKRAKEFNLKYTEFNNFYVKNQAFQREQEVQNRAILNGIIDEERQERIDAEERNRFIQQFWPVFLGVALLVIFSMIMGVRYYRALRTNKELAKAQLNAQAITSAED
ncbi:MAG: hypothetical protein Roseis2KO_13850 [Roseivirga sp.]